MNYGGRGISVCERWLNDFDLFVEDIGECSEKLTLERIDVNKGYSPDNCKWATTKEQGNNKRTNVLFEHDGTKLNVVQWAEKLGINSDTLWRRLHVYKIPMGIALTPESLWRKWAHGTRHGYEQGCRCSACKAVHATRHRAMRAKRKAKLLGATQIGAPAP
jgi:hypothetical protein